MRSQQPPSPTWTVFLNHHVEDLVSVDFFVVPTVRFRVLFVLVILAHYRRRVLHFDVTEHPTAQWTGSRLLRCFHGIRRRNTSFGIEMSFYRSQFQRRLKSQGIQEVLTAPRSLCQNSFVERVIGSIRRDCLDHVIVLNERHLKRIATSYFNYYDRWQTHLSLGMDSPESREVQPRAPGKVVQFPEAGGLSSL